MSDPLRLWSVTTLIRLGMGTSDPLVNWAVRTTAEAAFDRHKILTQFVDDDDRAGAVKWLADQRWQKSGKAMARGTDLHRAAEARALGQEAKVEPEVEPYLEQYDRFLSEFQPEFLLAESPVYSPRFGFAGTLDAVMKIDGKTVVADLKTTPHHPDSGRTRPPFPETAMQLTAYARADEIGLLSEQRYASGKRYYLYSPDEHHEPMIATDGGVVIVISPVDFMVVPVRTDDEVWRYFRHVMEIARWQVEASRNVFGPPVTRVAVA